jgi:hypothetical protein
VGRVLDHKGNYMIFLENNKNNDDLLMISYQGESFIDNQISVKQLKIALQ